MADSRLHQMAALGQSPWIDYLSLELLESGELERMMREDAIAGVTSNPTILQKAISAGNAYDAAAARAARGRGRPDASSSSGWPTDDVRRRLRPVAARLGLGRARPRRQRVARGRPDARVRHQRDDRAGRQRLSELVDRPNLYVKIPATKEGLPAIEEMIAAASRST